jgi:uncharacterized membrane protein YfcA
MIEANFLIWIPCLLFLAAALYASVGHAGASGYLAVMALFGVSATVMKPTALVLNLLVASVATFKFYRAGYFSWRIFGLFALSSVPFAFLGGRWTLPSDVYKVVVGIVLILSAIRLFYTTIQAKDQTSPKPLSMGISVLMGALIGLVSGLTGVGGGIFLSPLLLLTNAAETKQVSGISAAFIWVNSLAGLLGHGFDRHIFPPQLWLWALVVLVGGWLGATYGTQRFDTQVLKRLLALVLVIAGTKMVLG